MKKLLFAISFITAMILVSSCSDDSLDDVKNENTVNKNQISPSATATKVIQDTISNNSMQEADDAPPPPIDGGNPIRP